MSTLLATTTRNIGKLVPTNTVMMLCDIQERFRPLIYNSDTVVQTAKLMTQVSMKLDIPCIVTEQYPKAFGSTCIDCFEDVDAFIQTNGQPIAKKMFSMMVPEVRQKLSGLTERKSVLLFGVEAHVCVQQTALDLIEEGYDVHVVLDGTSSQVKYDREVSLERMVSYNYILLSFFVKFTSSHVPKITKPQPNKEIIWCIFNYCPVCYFYVDAKCRTS